MKPFYAEVTVKTTTDELIELNELIRRDEPMAVAEVDDKLGLVRCGACRTWNGKPHLFCSNCGQRLDKDTVQF